VGGELTELKERALQRMQLMQTTSLALLSNLGMGQTIRW